MRLINADALKKAITELDLDNTSHWSVIQKIDNAPSINIPIRYKGEWKRDNYGDVFCSNCSVECAYNEEGLYSLGRFCHHCGAEMWKGDET